MTAERLTQAQFEAIRRRSEAATAGPWEIDGEDVGIWNNGGFNYLGTAGSFCDDDANFIAKSREDIPALLAEVEWLRLQKNDLERFSQDELVWELIRRDEENGGDTSG